MELTSERIVVENGTISVSTTTGTTLTSDNVIKVLEERNTRHIQEQEQRWQNQILREQRAIYRVQKQQAAVQRRESRVQAAV